MGVYNATVITNAGQNLIASAIAGGQAINFTAVKTSTHVYPAGTALHNLTALSDVKQSVAPTSVDVYNNNVVQISARVPNTGIATAYLINTIGLFGSAGGAETLIAVLTAQTPDEVPVFDAEAPAAFIFNIQMTIQNADEVVFEVNDTGTATVADLNRVAQPFSGATASAAGSGGRVPAPAAGDDGKFLRGDATWTAPADMVEAFTSSDVADGGATAWTGVNPLTSGETNKSIFAKLSQMFKNIRYLYKMLGTTDISSIGNGTITNALSVLNANSYPLYITPNTAIPENSNLNSFTTPGKYICNSLETAATLSNVPFDTAGITYAFFMIVQHASSSLYAQQILFGCGYTTCPIYFREYNEGDWSSWCCIGSAAGVVYPNTALNSYVVPGKWICPTSAIATSLSNCPVQTAFILEVEDGTNKNYTIQTLRNTTNNNIPEYRRLRTGTTWGNWKQIVT